jgi:hypothetical protein
MWPGPGLSIGTMSFVLKGFDLCSKSGRFGRVLRKEYRTGNRGCRRLRDEIQAKTVSDDTGNGRIFWTPCVPKVCEILESSPDNAPECNGGGTCDSPLLLPSLRRIRRGGRGLVRGPLGLRGHIQPPLSPLTAHQNHR